MCKKLSLFLILISVGLLTALAAGPVFGQAADGLGKADAARQKHTDALMAKPGVAGVALGYNPGGQAAVTVYTEHRDVKGIPQKLDGVPVHVLVTGKLMALGMSTAPAAVPTSASHVNCYTGGESTTTDRCLRPVPIGVSTGHPDITACTIGARVVDDQGTVETADDVYYALSNNHCYADENLVAIGEDVIQPGTYDGGSSPADDIGTLAAFEPIVFSTSANNVIDAAIALSSTADLGNSTPLDGYGIPSSATVPAALNQKVQKYGRTTGFTEKARISGINATVNIGYSTGTARFVDQIIVKPGNFIAGGDSGSLMVIKGGTDDLKPVGLLFAGSSAIAIANPIGTVLTRFGVSIDDSTGPPPTMGSISGTVTDDTATPNPIDGATVETDTGQSVTTGINGTYMITGVPTGSRTVTASADGFMPADENATVSDGGTAAANFSLADMPTGSISGTVTKFDGGGAIAGAAVETDTGQSDTTDGNGDYIIADVPTGSRTVTASAAGFMPANQDTTVTDGVETTGVDFALEAPLALTITVSASPTEIKLRDPVTLSGQLTDSNGNGVDGVAVTILIYPSKGATLTPVVKPITSGGGNYSFTYTGRKKAGQYRITSQDVGGQATPAENFFTAER